MIAISDKTIDCILLWLVGNFRNLHCLSIWSQFHRFPVYFSLYLDLYLVINMVIFEKNEEVICETRPTIWSLEQ